MNKLQISAYSSLSDKKISGFSALWAEYYEIWSLDQTEREI